MDMKTKAARPGQQKDKQKDKQREEQPDAEASKNLAQLLLRQYVEKLGSDRYHSVVSGPERRESLGAQWLLQKDQLLKLRAQLRASEEQSQAEAGKRCIGRIEKEDIRLDPPKNEGAELPFAHGIKVKQNVVFRRKVKA